MKLTFDRPEPKEILVGRHKNYELVHSYFITMTYLTFGSLVIFIGVLLGFMNFNLNRLGLALATIHDIIDLKILIRIANGFLILEVIGIIAELFTAGDIIQVESK